MTDPASTIKAALRAKIAPERLAGVIAGLPPEAQAEIKRTFQPKAAKTSLRIRRK